MAQLTRKDLKHDKFAEEVGHSIDYVAGHRRQTILITAGALVLILLFGGIFLYRRHTHEQRQEALSEAIRVRDANVGNPAGPDDARLSFPTVAAKTAAEKKAYQDLASKYPGTDEGALAEFQLGVLEANAGNLPEAAKHLQTVVDTASKDFAASAKLSLAQVDASMGKTADAEKLLRDLMDNPTATVSKEQATISLARVIAKSKPDEAKKLLEPLQKDTRAAISRNAVAAMGEIQSAQ